MTEIMRLNPNFHNINTMSRSIEKVLDDAQNTGELYLSNRKLIQYPHQSSKYDLTDTMLIDISRNHFSEVPHEVCISGELLESLNCYDNAIRSVPPVIATLSSLVTLNLSNNQLSYIPAEICELRSLQVLLLSNNRLQTITDNVSHLQQLMQLDISCNELKYLPKQIGDLTHLKRLNIRRNFLETLPEELCAMALEAFDCSCNRITHLPLRLHLMASLDFLAVTDNPLQVPPAQICTRGRVHIMSFLRREASQRKHGTSFTNRSPFTRNVKDSPRFKRNVSPGYAVSKTVDRKTWSPGNHEKSPDRTITHSTATRSNNVRSMYQPSPNKDATSPKAGSTTTGSTTTGSTTTSTASGTTVYLRSNVDQGSRLVAQQRKASLDGLYTNISTANDFGGGGRGIGASIINTTTSPPRTMTSTTTTTGGLSRLRTESMNSSTETLQHTPADETSPPPPPPPSSSPPRSLSLNRDQGRSRTTRNASTSPLSMPCDLDYNSKELQRQRNEYESKKLCAAKKRLDYEALERKKVKDNFLNNTQRPYSSSCHVNSSAAPTTRVIPPTSSPPPPPTAAPLPVNQVSPMNYDADTYRRTAIKLQEATSAASSNINTAPAAAQLYTRRATVQLSSNSFSTAAANQNNSHRQVTRQLSDNRHSKSFTSNSSEDDHKEYLNKRKLIIDNQRKNAEMLHQRREHNTKLADSYKLEVQQPIAVTSRADPSFTMRRQYQMEEDQRLRIMTMRQILEHHLGLALPADLASALRDGVYLCHFMNRLCPHTITTVHVATSSNVVLSQAKARRNVESFLIACEKIGVPTQSLCNTSVCEENLLSLAKTINILMEQLRKYASPQTAV